MGAYGDKSWPAHEAWKQVAAKKQKLILGPQFRYAMHDECILAIVFGYHVPLLEKILAYSFPCEHESVIGLFTNKVDIKIRNGNLIISN